MPDRTSLKTGTIGKVLFENYKLGANYCRQQREKGGVAIFVHNSLASTNIDIVQHCKDQDIEICAVKLSFGALNICVVTLYRAPSGNFSSFYSNSTLFFKQYIHPSYT